MAGEGMTLDTKEIDNAISNVDTSAAELKAIGSAGAFVIVNSQKVAVPVDSGLTRTTISPHDVTSTADLFVTEVGPETEYAPNIEYGRRDQPNYPIQPFVRPSVFGNEKSIQAAIGTAFAGHLSKWPK